MEKKNFVQGRHAGSGKPAEKTPLLRQCSRASCLKMSCRPSQWRSRPKPPTAILPAMRRWSAQEPSAWAPVKIANILAECIDCASARYIDRVEIAGPGFINFFVSDAWFASIVSGVLEAGEEYGRSDIGKGEKVMVEFVSANPTGPMHMGNARGGAIGDCLAAALDACGYDVTREFYINDAGNQIEKFGLSLEARYLQIYKGEEAVPFPEDGYHGEDIKERAQQYADEHGDCLLNLSEAERRQALSTSHCRKILRSCAPTWKNTASPTMSGSRKAPCTSPAQSRQWSMS